MPDEIARGESGEGRAEHLLSLFTEEHWKEQVPKLDEGDVSIVREHMEERGMQVIAGVAPIGDMKEAPMGTILSLNGHASAELANFPDTEVGPYILGETYFEEGVAVWGLQNRAGIEPRYGRR